MTLINLRPWREERRLERQQRFLTVLAMVALLSVVIVMAVGFLIENQTSKQKQRNDYLRQEMTKLDVQIREIQDLNAKRDRLLERLQAIQDLQGHRPVIVRVFDELVRVLPDQLFYTSLNRAGDSLHVQGVAKGNKDVSELLRNMDGSAWFSNPNLNAVGKQDTQKSFDMKVLLSKPNPDAEAEGA